MRSVWLLALAGGCSLYFEPPDHHEPSAVDPLDAGLAPVDGSPSCPKPGTHAEILYPLDDATDVPQPVPIQMHVFIPNTADGKGIWLTDANGVQVELSHWTAACSVPPPAIQPGPTQDVTWTECYSNLVPDAIYTWHVYLTCYDDSGIHELASSTFRTAP